ncbi:MAG: hydrogen gas-evolving membrane-bound hydrogenase subunit E, partial [Herbaspirillum sp.]
HSATMVKAGVFLLVRLWPVLAGTDVWLWIIGGAGACSLILGAYAATFQRDMKGVLAYSTISHLGLITLLLGLNSRLALVAAIFHIINHATFKSSLFMAAGMVDHETGTRDLSRLSGLYRVMPITAMLAVVAAASMAGVPLLNGFISKEMFFTETVFISGNQFMRTGLPLVAVVYGVLSVAYSLRFILQVFFGPPALDLPRQPHEPPGWMLVPSALLVLACLVVGILPALTVGPVLDLAARSVLGDAAMPYYNLVLWHGWNLPLVMSLLAMAGGVLLYLMLGKYQRRAPGVVPLIEPVSGKRIFDFVLDSTTRAAGALGRALGPERLQTQLLLIVGVAFCMALIPIWQNGWPQGDLMPSAVDPVFALLWLIGGTCALVAARQAKYHRLAALTLVGAVGIVTSITFAWFSAPDLALTQLAVEVVTVVLILLGLRWLPPRFRSDDAEQIPLRQRVQARSRRLRDLLLATVVGTGFGMLSYAVLTHHVNRGLGSFFVENARALADGANVVNVILVDFRGFDTFGEITVLGIVALSVYALLRRFRPAPESLGRPGPQREQDRKLAWGQKEGVIDTNMNAGVMAIPAVLVRLLAPLALMVSIFFLLRGHNAPGGGFVGGLVLATAAILQYMVGGTVWAESRTRIHPQYWIGFGL